MPRQKLRKLLFSLGRRIKQSGIDIVLSMLSLSLQIVALWEPSTLV